MENAAILLMKIPFFAGAFPTIAYVAQGSERPEVALHVIGSSVCPKQLHAVFFAIWANVVEYRTYTPQ